MDLKEEVLNFLIKAEDYASGVELAQNFGVSRNAIWKAVKQLIEKGIKIDSKPNKGYKLAEFINFVNKTAISNYLDDDFFKIEVFDQINSTSTYLKESASKFGEGTVVYARSQTAGKGRLDRKFYSPKDCGIYFSLIVKPNKKADSSIYLTVLSAVSVVQGIKEATGIDTDIKWVNDIYLNGKKIAGILSEGSINFEMGNLDYCVIGIGLNVVEPICGMDEEIKSLATTLYPNGSAYNINLIAAKILKYFKINYQKYLHNDYSFVEEYKNKQMLIGKEVISVNLATMEEEKILVTGINDDCSLSAKTKTGEIKKINSGEVRIIVNK